MPANSSVLIVGTGALASLFAARLAATGCTVTMLGSWPDGLAALQTHGVRLLDADGAVKTYAVRATSDPTECRGIPQALVLVKAWQTAARLSCLALASLLMDLRSPCKTDGAIEKFLNRPLAQRASPWA